MAEKKSTAKKKADVQRVMVSFYPEEHETVLEALSNGVDGLDDDDRVDTDNLNSRDIRQLFGLRPTHRKVGVKREIAERLKDMSEEEQQEILDDLKEKAGEED